MNTYRGVRSEAWAVAVTVNGRPLPAGEGLFVAAWPVGYEWGYHGTGPNQLAFSILLHELRHLPRARYWFREFRENVVARLDFWEWELTSVDITNALDQIARERSPVQHMET